MRFDIVSLFPDMFHPLREQGVTGRACARGQWQLHTWNPRTFTQDAHQTVDDRPYGGGPGMVMLAEPLAQAVEQAKKQRNDSAAVLLMSPMGQHFNQKMAQDLAKGSGAILVCGRYEGIDQRFIDRYVSHEISLGDFVLSGGEIAALAIVDATVRLLPGVLGHALSASQDSFHEDMHGLLDSPHYSRPERWQEQAVPEVLLSGHHENIAHWRRQASLRLTQKRRPDLIRQARQLGLLSPADELFLDKGVG